MPELLAEHRIPGAAIGLCSPDGTLWTAGFGSTRASGGEPIVGTTMFSVQSCSKMYTAVATMLAGQMGLVALDRPITMYLPEFRVKSRFETTPERKITLRHLLSHTAGFTHEAPVGNNYLVGQASFEAHCRSIADTWLRFPVGHHYEYSNLGIDLAAYVLQGVSRMTFHEFVRRNLLAPLGLKSTTFDQQVIAREPQKAVGHSKQTKRLPIRIPMVAAGGLYTSIEDACRFVRFHLAGGESLLDPRLLAETYSIPFARPGQGHGYALGISISSRNGFAVRGHGGGGFGFLCDMYWSPHAGVGVVFLTSSTDHPLQGRLVAAILRDLAGEGVEPSRPLPSPVAASSEKLQRIAGEYMGRAGVVTIVAAEGELFFVDKERQRHGWSNLIKCWKRVPMNAIAFCRVKMDASSTYNA